MKKIVTCPGCGKRMECNEPHLYVFETPESLEYICGYRCSDYRCGWCAPIGKGKTPEKSLNDAYKKAVRRASKTNTAPCMEENNEACDF